jgi:hypothetical protein
MEQFVHHPWNGLRFWDLYTAQFYVYGGTAMASFFTTPAGQE